MVKIDIVKNERINDPLNRGYLAMNRGEILIDMNTVYQTTNKSSLTGSEILNAVDKAEYLALTDPNKQVMWDIVHLGNINPFGIEADLFVDIFSGGSATITALQALRINNVTRGQKLKVGILSIVDIDDTFNI